MSTYKYYIEAVYWKLIHYIVPYLNSRNVVHTYIMQYIIQCNIQYDIQCLCQIVMNGLRGFEEYKDFIKCLIK